MFYSSLLDREQTRPTISPAQAGIAQLVERNLAKVEVASSSLVSRSRICVQTPAGQAGVFCCVRRIDKVGPEMQRPFVVNSSGFLHIRWARWQSGHAAACKAVYAGSIPTLASSFDMLARPGWRNR